MRGKVIDNNRLCPPAGITPAYAGKRWQKAFIEAVYRDHPRLCGEKHLTKSCGTVGEGSPPPMRGKAVFLRCGYTAGRITPAYAGKSKMMRNRNRSFVRITPAYAGKRHQVPECQQRIWDHPRLCGEKLSQSPEAFNGTGSPPPMRGKVSGESPAKAECGITPAYAGKSSRSV